MEIANAGQGVVRALIVDDEPGARDIMDHLLCRIPDIQVIGKASSADEALDILINQSPDLVFLDIQMPEKNGFQLVEYLQKFLLETHVIFVTAHAEYAIDALKVAAFDYLLKPVMMTELQETILRYRAKKHKEAILAAHEPAEKPAKQGRIKFNTRTGYLFIDPQDIMYCEADVNYTSICFGKDNREVVTVPLGKVEEILAPYPFYRINRSVLINQLYLSRADRRKKQCLLIKDNERVILEISSAHLRELEKYLDGL